MTDIVTTFDDLDGDVDMVFPASLVNVGEETTAELLPQSELLFGQLPFVHHQMVQVCGFWPFLNQDNRRTENWALFKTQKQSGSYPLAWFAQSSRRPEDVAAVVLHQVDQRGELWRRLDFVVVLVPQDLEVFHPSARPHCTDDIKESVHQRPELDLSF